MLAYENMDVYRCAIQFLSLSAKALEGIAEDVPLGSRARLAKQDDNATKP